VFRFGVYIGVLDACKVAEVHKWDMVGFGSISTLIIGIQGRDRAARPQAPDKISSCHRLREILALNGNNKDNIMKLDV